MNSQDIVASSAGVATWFLTATAAIVGQQSVPAISDGAIAILALGPGALGGLVMQTLPEKMKSTRQVAAEIACSAVAGALWTVAVDHYRLSWAQSYLARFAFSFVAGTAGSGIVIALGKWMQSKADHPHA